MFYPADSLKRGGRFHLCWIADSWPSRFEQLTHRRNQQIWAQDIRQLCESLRQLMNSESGRPTRRFSLRLSSQLMRGLVRIYQKKVDFFCHDIWKMQIMVIRKPRSETTERGTAPRTRVFRELPRLVLEEVPPEVHLEEIQENTCNTVARIEDITLREPNLPEIRAIEDGFGELNQNPVEMMLAQEVSVMQQSALDLPLETTDKSHDKSHDKSRLAPHDTAQMERISEHDNSLFRKSAVEAPSLFEQDIPIPEIPPPESFAPELQNKEPLQEAQIEAPARPNESEQFVLEDLEEEPPQKRRKLKQLIVDQSIKISSDYFAARVANNDVELRCDDVNQDRIDVNAPVPAALLLNRERPAARLGRALAAKYARGYVEDEEEEAMVQRPMIQEPIDVEMQAVDKTIPDMTIQDKTIPDMTIQDKTIQEPDAQEHIQRISNIDVEAAQMEMADLPTQKVLTVSQGNRAGDVDNTPKGRRQLRSSSKTVPEIEANKENIPGAENIPVQEHTMFESIPRVIIPTEATESSVQQLNAMLRESGLADARDPAADARDPTADARGPTADARDPTADARGPAADARDPTADARGPTAAEPATSARKRPTDGSDGSETPLGSLDRTKVSLGDSDRTTDSQKFIDDEWGVQGTMLKIFRCVVKRKPQITVHTLVRRGPVLPGHERIIAARCFTSILKLRSHDFIKVIKDEEQETLEIKHIELGPRITNPRPRPTKKS